ncbi:50S ribosomal protein L13 [Flagellatimonas centrodinii]|uniref:50S ribosomal protein L13 n=1 Tax=Flagellatimonas centrodinii TaxID=2806210 RepID=UPI001FEDE26A|nr:50S ribosomal protein L13 [Flagellatimonas centrodinii]ULQ45435.1 50S ribosomal protein L13 [Flagellatimonas centrodinii]
MKTVFINNENAQRDWYVLDADGVTLGRLATEVARRLRGKHKPEYTPNADNGDYIVVINAEKVKTTGNKVQDKMYYSHSQFPGGLKSVSLGKVLDTHPERAIQHAVKGMLPRGPLGYAQFRKLKVYAGAEHPHTAQQPKTLTL